MTQPARFNKATRRGASLGLIIATAAAVTIGASGVALAGGPGPTIDHLTITTASNSGHTLAGASFAIYLPGGDDAMGFGRSGFGATAAAAQADAIARGSQRVVYSASTLRAQKRFNDAYAAYDKVYGNSGSNVAAAQKALDNAGAALFVARKNASGPHPTPAQLQAVKAAIAADNAASAALQVAFLDSSEPNSAAAKRSPTGKAYIATFGIFKASGDRDGALQWAAEGRQIRGKLTTNARGVASGYAYIGSQIANGNDAPPEPTYVTIAETKAPAGHAAVRSFKIHWNVATSKWDLVDAAHHSGIHVATGNVVQNSDGVPTAAVAVSIVS